MSGRPPKEKLPNEMADYIVKDEATKKKINNLDRINADFYKAKNIVEKKQDMAVVSQEKHKFIEKRTFRNGVVKNRIVGVEKYNSDARRWKITFDRGIDKTQVQPQGV